MKNLFKKIFATLAIIALLGSLVINTPAPTSTPIAYASNNNQDDCGEKFPYEKTGDFNDSRVNIDFTDYQNHSGSSNDGYYKISVSADAGYKINKVWLDVDDDGQSGYVQVATGAINNFNPSGDVINKVKVEVEKVCAEEAKVNICHATSSQSNPWEAIRVNTSAFDGQGQNDHTQHNDFLYNGPVNPQNQQPTNDNWCEDNLPGDKCSNIGGFQANVPLGYTADGSICTQIVDVCANIPEIQTSLPANHYFEDEGNCAEKTPVCTDSAAANYDDNVSENEYSNNNVCQYPIDVCLNIPDTQTTLPDGYHFEGEGNCIEDEEEKEVCEDRTATNYGEEEACEYDEEEFTCPDGQEVSQDENGYNICIDCPGGGDCEVIIGGTPTPTPTATPTATLTPTPTNTPSNGGDNNDNNNDNNNNDNNNDNNNNNGGVGGATTTSEKQGEVLGVNTLPQTGNIASTLATIEQALGVVFVTLGAMLYGKKKVAKKTK